MANHSGHGIVRQLCRLSFGLLPLAAACLPAASFADIYDDGGGFIITRVHYEASPSFWQYTNFKNKTGVDAYDFHFYFTDAAGRPVGDVINIDFDPKQPLASGQSFVPSTVITDNGDVGRMGHGWWTDADHHRITSSVPEPSSLLLLLAGCLVLMPRLIAPRRQTKAMA